MTNQQLIINAALNYGIYSEEQIEEIIRVRGELPIHSYLGWRERAPRGYEYRIKKGEHGIETRLWKLRKKQEKRSTEEATDERGLEEKKGRFYLTKTYLFSEEQVELVKKD